MRTLADFVVFRSVRGSNGRDKIGMASRIAIILKLTTD